MNTRSRLHTRAAITAMIAALGAASPFLTSAAHSAPKKQLELWPDRRVLLVLPLATSSTWNADADLGRAIIPLTQPQLQQDLTATGKFSITLPYRFDPVLRRGLVEKRFADNDIKALLDNPTLETARPIVDKLAFDQPVMIADIKLEELRIGGTPKMPTVQIQASGRLYQQGSPNPIKSIVVTSNPTSGKTPSDRIRLAASQAFSEIAAEFIAAPPAFDLPAPIAPPTPAPAAGTPGAPAVATPAPGAPAPVAPPARMGAIMPPNAINTAPGAALVPVLPGGQPPLGVGAGADGTVGR